MFLAAFFGRILGNHIVAVVFLSGALMIVVKFISHKCFQNEPMLRTVLFSAIIIRFVVIFLSQIIPQLTIPSDAVVYQQTGVEIARKWMSGDFLYISGGGSSGRLQFIYYLYNAFCFLLFGNDFLVPRIFNAFLGVLSGIILFSIAEKIFCRKVAKYTMGIYLLFPSIVYWQSMNLKEAMIVLMLLTTIKHLLMFCENISIKHIVIASIFSLGLALLRIYLGLLLFVLIIAIFIYLSKFKISKKILILSLLLMLLGLGTVSQGYGVFGFRLFTNYNLESLNNIRKIAYEGGSQVLSNYDTSTFSKLLGFIPLASVYFWFAPFIWQWGDLPNSFAKMAALENIVVTLMFLFMALPGMIIMVKRRVVSGIVIIFIIFILSMFYIISYGNMGLGLRMRDQLMPLIIMSAVAGYFKFYKRQGCNLN